MKQAINNIIYDTEESVSLASGSELICVTELYRTKKGKYFQHVTVRYSPEPKESIEVLSTTQALEVFNKLSNRFIDYGEAFPDITFEDA